MSNTKTNAVTPTNLIFFLADNHARNLLGVAGHPIVQTPNLDRIAIRGTRFTNAYTGSPVCCPARAALATGRYPHQSGYWDNALAYDGRLPTWHGRIRDQGHNVTSVGKLHFQSSENDNGFTEEIIPMHIVDGAGSLIGLLRSTPGGVPQRTGGRDIYASSGIGEADYQRYDAHVTESAIEWLQKNGRKQSKPWILFISYASPHPPFSIPKRLFDLYPLENVPLPVQFRADDRPTHPAVANIRRICGFEDEPVDEEFVRRVIAGYCGLVTYTDEQVGRVMRAADSLGILNNTRVIYSSDHGEAAGNHGLFGKSVLYEHSAGVPLLMSGPEIPAGQTVSQFASHVDLFHTVVETVGATLKDEDQDLKGISLWPAIHGRESSRLAFSEYHGLASQSGGFLLRNGMDKLIYHVDMPRQYFNLENDPRETHDLAESKLGNAKADKLEAQLRSILDPEEVDQRAKKQQRAHLDLHGGELAVRKRGTYSFTPVPGDPVKMETLS